MAFTDLFQVPLIIAIVCSVVLSRRWRRAWKGIGVALGGYALWVAATALLVGFSPSGYLVLTLGTLLDPFEPMWKATSTTRVWAIGLGGTVLLLWAIPTGLAWLLRRKGPVVPVSDRPRPWTTPALVGLLLLVGQQLLLTYAGRLEREWREGGPGARLDDRSSMPFGIALALTLPIVLLLAIAALRWLKARPRSRSSL